MPRGRQPEGETTLSNAERQARYRARHKADRPTPVVRCAIGGRPTGAPGSQRWDDAVAELLALQAEYAAWYDALPDGFRDTATAEALRAIAELDLTELAGDHPAARLRPGLTYRSKPRLVPQLGKMRRVALTPLDDRKGKCDGTTVSGNEPT